MTNEELADLIGGRVPVCGVVVLEVREAAAVISALRSKLPSQPGLYRGDGRVLAYGSSVTIGTIVLTDAGFVVTDDRHRVTSSHTNANDAVNVCRVRSTKDKL